ncbi:MAG: hypothetical protein ABUJ93_09635 [Hyphomicrobium sp.]|jgi:hypothetical protein
MEVFAYDSPAEIFSSDGRVTRKRAVTNRRFARSAEAIRFAIEQLPQPMQPGTVMEVDGDRIQITQIRALYDSQRYPLSRRDPQHIAAGRPTGKRGYGRPQKKLLLRAVVPEMEDSDARFP